MLQLDATTLTAVALLLVFAGMLIGALWHRAGLFPFARVNAPKHTNKAGSAVASAAQPAKETDKWLLQVRVEYAPKLHIEMDEQGQEHLVNENGFATLQIPSEQVALVLVDTWSEADELDAPTPILQTQERVLRQCREHGVTIVHAPNHPAVDKYPQYQRLRQEVTSFVAPYNTGAKNPPPFMKWPLAKNPVQLQAQTIRREGRAASPKLRQDPEISRRLTPLPDEYVLSSHMEFRYVLWREGINLLLYMGKSLNECILHRDTGINPLAGTDSARVPFTIVVLKDCSAAAETADFKRDVLAATMLDYYKQKIAFVANSTDLVFERNAKRVG